MSKWTIVSVYIGKKKQHQGLTFNTRFEFPDKASAEWYADMANDMRQDRWPGHEFEFQAAPYETTADTSEE